MPNSRLKLLFYWLILIFIVVTIAELAGYGAMVHDSRQRIGPTATIDSFTINNLNVSSDFMSNESYFHIRHMLLGDTDSNQFPRYLSQPYLTYIPYPGYSRLGKQEHNNDGYRGERVPLEKKDTYRILCLGGSTTYGSGVFRYEQTYPYQLKSILNQYLATNSSLALKYKGVEVINAGIEAGTSAEELEQYIFKYHYYKSDLVIIETGINDATIRVNDGNYQPDYTHYRRNDFSLNPLPPQSRWLMKSYFCSYIIIRLFYSSLTEHFFDKFAKDSNVKFCKWNTVNVDSLAHLNNYSYYGYYHNFDVMLREIRQDSAKIILLPAVLNPGSPIAQYHSEYTDNVVLYNRMMEKAAALYGCNFLNFTSDSISFKKYGVDECHLNAGGERLKAEMVARRVINIMD